MSIKSKTNSVKHEPYLYRPTNILTRSRTKAFDESCTIKEKDKGFKSTYIKAKTIQRKKKQIKESLDEEIIEPKDFDIKDSCENEDNCENDFSGDEEIDNNLTNKKLIEKKKHCLVEAKCRRRRIELYKNLHNVIESIEEKLNHQIPLYKIIDNRRKVDIKNGKYTQEHILRKIYSTILINEKFIKNNNQSKNLINSNNDTIEDENKNENENEDENENENENIGEIKQNPIEKIGYYGLKNLLLASEIDGE
ncbi:hypothetical protein DDB_G0287907 [Dictyostelium discoideum AX4]|uniref:Uncharacterized protein n=1 Tax=Dictyostelium discoideum TaxID=44689 RepID=Q54JP8_DICDI|nr:hypothetical protein DDB_G0287907 [Dictyostelium discoideum AX4]EAL63482.1 hypothetical protein DDB_G0287907 [Dictyostelium discoideum AX4]|eukprot:XP_636986.1 hypothetical protein DDB_G0287907 [Dictyostelium discoideum AX4]